MLWIGSPPLEKNFFVFLPLYADKYFPPEVFCLRAKQYPVIAVHPRFPIFPSGTPRPPPSLQSCVSHTLRLTFRANFFWEFSYRRVLHVSPRQADVSRGCLSSPVRSPYNTENGPRISALLLPRLTDKNFLFFHPLTRPASFFPFLMKRAYRFGTFRFLSPV